MLDQLSGGRLELGVGRGVSPYELGCFGVDPGATREIFDEALAVMVAGMTRDRLTFAGKHFRYADVPMELRPLQRPYPPLWYPTHNPQSIAYAAKHGYHFVGLGSAAQLRAQMDLYRDVWAKNRDDPGRLNAHVSEPKLGTLRQVFIADSDDEALAIAEAAHRSWYRSITKLWHDHDDRSVDALFAWDGGIQNETILVGSPARVREQVARLLEESTCNYLIGAFAWGTLGHARAARSLRLFAEEVMPAMTAGSSARS